MQTLRNFGYFNLLVGIPLFYLSFSVWFLGLLPLGLLFVGLGWAYRRRPFLSSGGQAGLGSLPLLSLVAAFVGLSAWASRPFRQTVLVPAGYRGVVVIGYDAPAGQPPAWEEDGRLIRVSARGTATTRFPIADQGDIAPENDKFYAVTATGQRTRLPELKTQIPVPAHTVGIYHSYLDGHSDLLVFVVARADSLTYFLEPESLVLSAAYTRQVQAIGESMAAGYDLND